MIKVIDRVISERYQNNRSNGDPIQLSSILMKKYLEELKIFSTKPFSVNSIGEIGASKYGIAWTIMNREYRDDTNDKDVEEALYKLAQDGD